MSEVKAVVFNAEDRRLIREYVNSQWWAANRAKTTPVVPDPEITDVELEQLLTRASLSGLNPMAGHIHATRRDSRLVLVTSIDAYRLAADRTGCYAPGDDTIIRYNPDDPTIILSATVSVKKLVAGTWHVYTATAFMEEYAQRYRVNGQYVLASMWAKMPRNQLAKCAEALALRRGFPQELAGLYVEEELQQVEGALEPAFRPEGGARAAAASTVAELAQKTITQGEPNRGHGNEGKPATVPVPDSKVAPAVAAAGEQQTHQQQVAADKAKWETIRATSQSIMGKITESVGKATTKDKNPFVIFTMETPNGATRKLTCFDTRFLALLLNAARGQNAVVYYVVKKKGNGAEYMNLTDIGEVGGVPYWMGEPVPSSEGITDEDIPF